MKLTRKKIKKVVDLCEPTERFISNKMKFGRKKLQLVCTNNCGSWIATLTEPDKQPWLFANPRLPRRRIIRRYRRANRALYFEGEGKTRKAAIADLVKWMKTAFKEVKLLEKWFAEHPIEAK